VNCAQTLIMRAQTISSRKVSIRADCIFISPAPNQEIQFSRFLVNKCW